jgi:galactonate dehydratase
MRVTDLRIFVVDADWRDFVFVKVFTDEGLTGVGEATLSGQEPLVVAALKGIKSYILGKNPLDIEDHWRNLYHSSFWRGVPFLAALGALEQALWDILGKSLGAPVWQLLGGRCRSQVRCYTHISEETSGHSIAQRVEEAQQAVAEGWTALKWDPLPRNFLTLSPAQLGYVVDQIRAVREAVGDEIDLLVELHGRLDPTTAIQLSHAIAPLRPLFMEEPVPPDSIDMLARVAAHSSVPLAVGERVFTKYDYWPILERQLVSFIQPDVIFVGGILEAKKIAAMADARYIAVAPHNPHGPVCTAATLHLVANIPNFAIQEMPADDYLWSARWRDELLLDPTPVIARDGHLAIPTAPGLGVDLDEQAIARYPARARDWGVSFQAKNAIID